MKSSNSFCIFILSHNRANCIDTLDYVIDCGYTGDYFVVISTDNKQIDEYKKKVGENHLLIFDKKKIATDTMLSSSNFEPNSSLYARNYICEYVLEQGYEYFLMADDDIKGLWFKMNVDGIMKEKAVKNLDKIIEYLISFLKVDTRLSGICPNISTGYFGGVAALNNIRREVFQFIIFKSSNIRTFKGVHMEDVILTCNNIDNIYITFPGLCFKSPEIGSNNGGIAYDPNNLPPYLFYYIAAPSSVELKGQWKKKRYANKMYPKIISSDYKKL